ncbi:hypothetical protein [Pontibacillus yanchengensis]|uniref:Replication protein n=1 Tax=Pontibacillus yanchengensis Y32 TaxID=1385514 RepID=A0A0A2TBQ8_9BACI|nr:hypothetical protein [Pontibacillus yanchengensis]KGP71511.1 hypothetical protein N782_18490 [Pontibacillus yanchengensis Y32]
MTNYRVVDEDGVIVEGAKVIPLEQQKAISKAKEKETVINKSKNPFVFTEMDGLQESLSKLNNKDLGYLLIMQTYIDYKNMIKLKNDSKLPMNKKQLQQMLKIKSDKTLRNLLKRLESKGFIYSNTVELYGKSHKAFFIADKYCFRKGVSGAYKNRKTNNAVKVFIKSLQDVFSQGGTQPADIGFIYKTIPYIHYESNMLTVTPNEKELSEIKFLTINGLAKLLGLSRVDTTNKLGSIVWNGQYVFARTKVGAMKELSVKVNPYVLYRQSGDPTGAIGAEFVATPYINS